jgi:hypothetical protein
MLVATSAPLGWDRVKVSENSGATPVAPVAPVVTSLKYNSNWKMEIKVHLRIVKKVQLENGNKSPFTNWRFIPIPIKKLKQNSIKITKIE